MDRIEDDFHLHEFVRVLRSLEPHLPVSDAYERDCPQLQHAWWSSQQEHMVAWFQGQNSQGSGAFTRGVPNVSARTTYNRLLCPAAFVWMAEALGEDSSVVQTAADAARNENNPRKHPGLLRQHLPWARIVELVRAV